VRFASGIVIWRFAHVKFSLGYFAGYVVVIAQYIPDFIVFGVVYITMVVFLHCNGKQYLVYASLREIGGGLVTWFSSPLLRYYCTRYWVVVYFVLEITFVKNGKTQFCAVCGVFRYHDAINWKRDLNIIVRLES